MTPKAPSRGACLRNPLAGDACMRRPLQLPCPGLVSQRPLTFSWIRHWEMLCAWYMCLSYESDGLNRYMEPPGGQYSFLTDDAWWTTDAGYTETVKLIFLGVIFERLTRMTYDGQRMKDTWRHGFRRSQFVCVCLHLCLHRITLTDQLLHGATFFP